MDMNFKFEPDKAAPIAADFAPAGYDPRVTYWLIEEIFADIAAELTARGVALASH